MSHFIKWCRDFKNGITDASDPNRTGQPSASKTDVNEDLVMNCFLNILLSTLLGLCIELYKVLTIKNWFTPNCIYAWYQNVWRKIKNIQV